MQLIYLNDKIDKMIFKIYYLKLKCNNILYLGPIILVRIRVQLPCSQSMPKLNELREKNGIGSETNTPNEPGVKTPLIMLSEIQTLFLCQVFSMQGDRTIQQGTGLNPAITHFILLKYFQMLSQIFTNQSVASLEHQ